MQISTTSLSALREFIPVDDPGSPSGGDDWLGQVPPPPPPSTRPEPAPPRETYANPHLAPEPWKSDPVLPGTDPTLFG